MKIIKKDGTVEGWNGEKIKEAVYKAAARVNQYVEPDVLNKLVEKVHSCLIIDRDAPTKDLHKEVIHYLKYFGLTDVANSYQEYRDYKNTYSKSFEKVKDEADNVLLLGDRENANFDSSLVSTKGSLIKGYLTKELYRQFYLSKEEKELTKRGDIYIHDMRDMLMGSVNCCLFDIGNVLRGGFSMSNVDYTEPTSVLSALQVIGDITLVATAQQFGGFSLSQLDMVLLPYCEKTLKKAYKHAKHCFPDSDPSSWDLYARRVLKDELKQGFQSLELKLNTVPCSRGDFAFTTISFGCWNTPQWLGRYLNDTDLWILKEICSAILNTRMNGHGENHKPVVFPKLVYLYVEDSVRFIKEAHEIFDLAIKCSSKCMYPDFLSLTGDWVNNAVAKQYLKNGQVVTPMGCRAYLSPWKDPETNQWITNGRCNIGAVSLNLPLILAYSQKNNVDFFSVVDARLETIRNFFKKRYALIRHTKACTNPMAFMQGGFYKGNLKADDEIGDLVNYMTASFGVTALNELNILGSGKTLYQDPWFARTVLKRINDKVEQFKKEDGYLYAVYGTPAENLCGVQAKQYADYTGDHQFGEYFTNSFHMHVNENITPFEKQDAEYEMFHLCNGGHIVYNRVTNPENLQALKALILRGMEKGFYQGINFDSAYCEDCGKHSTNVMNKCPHCGSTNLSVISRVCGYLGYTKANGSTRMNDAKLAEIKDRVSM
jgi:ribonucleoside-triphosphate reductase|nr:MAG TPA: anaerobic ribonucleoside triphosphate reductase [Caudoviricetes sp.]